MQIYVGLRSCFDIHILTRTKLISQRNALEFYKNSEIKLMTGLVKELLKPQEKEWLCSSNEAVTIWFRKSQRYMVFSNRKSF